MINYYRDVWRNRSHYLEPLTCMVGKKSKFKWGKPQQDAFDKLKAVVAEETMLKFPDFSKPFIIHTDASDYQLGSVITQDEQPIAFFSRKMNPAQRKYTTIEKELLSISETLKEYKTMLKGQKIKIFTDHKNLTYPSTDFQSDRVLRQRLLIDEFGAEIIYIKGESNVVADALSRLETGAVIPMQVQNEHKIPEAILNRRVYKNLCDDFPMRFDELATAQLQDEGIRSLVNNEPEKIDKQYFGGIELFVVRGQGPQSKEWKIAVPKAKIQAILDWYHGSINHPGATRTYATISQHFHWKGIKAAINDHVRKCPTCQLSKRSNKHYGLVPISTPETDPWNTVQVDMIGPWILKRNAVQLEFKALTMIEPVTCWPEIALTVTMTSAEVSNAFDT